MNIKLRSIMLSIILILSVFPLMANGIGEQIENPDLIVEIDGMYCSLCSDAVKKSFEENEDVIAVSANHKTGTANVVLANKTADLQTLTDFFETKLIDLGYSLISVTEGATND